MSKKKKTIIGVIIAIICLITIPITVVFSVKSINKYVEQRKHERLLKETMAEVTYINENSDFCGIELMDSPPKNFERWETNTIWNEKNRVGSYYCWEFNRKYCINEITIESCSGNVLGMYVGENYDKAIELMTERNYVLNSEKEESDNNTRYLYKKAYVKIVFEVTPENDIAEIFVNIWDPYNMEQYACINYYPN